MIRQLMAALFPEREKRMAHECRNRPECPDGVHYHYGWANRNFSLTPHTGDGSFSDGRPFLKRRKS